MLQEFFVITIVKCHMYFLITKLYTDFLNFTQDDLEKIILHCLTGVCKLYFETTTLYC